MDGKRNAARNILMWAATALLTVGACMLWNSSGVLLAAAALLTLPVEKCRKFFDRFLAWKWLIVILLIAAALCIALIHPSAGTSNNISTFDPTFFME